MIRHLVSVQNIALLVSHQDFRGSLLSCPDRKGVVAAIAGFIYQHGGNILHADEHGDLDSSTFLMRVEFDPAELDLPLSDFLWHFSPIANEFDMHWRVALSDVRLRMAILVSKYDHCLVDRFTVTRAANWPATFPASFPTTLTVNPLPISIASLFSWSRSKRGQAGSGTKCSRYLNGTRWISSCSPATCRFFPTLRERVSEPHHQYSPFVPAGFCRGQTLPPGFHARREADRRTSHYVTEVSTTAPSSSRTWSGSPTATRWMT